jgi:hypothetical protein
MRTLLYFASAMAGALCVCSAECASADADPPELSKSVPTDLSKNESAWAFIAPKPPPDSVFVFGGQYTTGSMGDSLDPFKVHHESDYIIAGAYAHDFFYLPLGFIIGVEGGAGFRFGNGESGEFWGGPDFRFSGIVFFDTVRVSPGITVGFSAITAPMGIEAERASQCCNKNPYFLGYLGPELAFAVQKIPNLELVFLLQHRSGAKGTFGGMGEGANADCLGIRYRF